MSDLRSPKTDKPWHKYRKESGKILEPGWPGPLAESELAYILSKLREDDALSYWWGWRPGQKSRSAAAIQRVAMWGDPEVRSVNVHLARSGKCAIVPEKGREGAFARKSKHKEKPLSR